MSASSCVDKLHDEADKVVLHVQTLEHQNATISAQLASARSNMTQFDESAEVA